MNIQKFFICLIIVLIIILFISGCAKQNQTDNQTVEQIQEEEIDLNSLATVKGNIDDTAKLLASYLEKDCPNKYAVCGALGMMYRESQFFSQAVAGFNYYGNNYEERIEYLQDWTAEIDKGLADGSTKEKFINNILYKNGGYGLGQWWSYEYLNSFYDFAQKWGTSIGDAEMQCAYTMSFLKEEKPLTWTALCKCHSAFEAGLIIGQVYDGTNCYLDIAGFAEDFWFRLGYDKGE